eukprot:gene3370-13403_t
MTNLVSCLRPPGPALSRLGPLVLLAPRLLTPVYPLKGTRESKVEVQFSSLIRAQGLYDDSSR